MGKAGLTTFTTALAAACLLASAASAQQADSPLKSVMKLFGFATDVGEPQDFVVQSRPKTEPDYVPIFQPPPEPARKLLDDKGLNKLKGNLDAVQKRDDGLRSGFPPAAKAVAEEKAAQAKAAKKPDTPANP
jgi:hypothetical protein